MLLFLGPHPPSVVVAWGVAAAAVAARAGCWCCQTHSQQQQQHTARVRSAAGLAVLLLLVGRHRPPVLAGASASSSISRRTCLQVLQVTNLGPLPFSMLPLRRHCQRLLVLPDTLSTAAAADVTSLQSWMGAAQAAALSTGRCCSDREGWVVRGTVGRGNNVGQAGGR
jgi:hypothetical protein